MSVECKLYKILYKYSWIHILCILLELLISVLHIYYTEYEYRILNVHIQCMGVAWYA
jgi:hypothetical protein